MGPARLKGGPPTPPFFLKANFFFFGRCERGIAYQGYKSLGYTFLSYLEFDTVIRGSDYGITHRDTIEKEQEYQKIHIQNGTPNSC